MARLRARVERAAMLHRQAAAAVAVSTSALDAYSAANAPAEQYAEQYGLAARLRSAAADLTPGWLGASIDATPAGTPLRSTLPAYVRIGLAQPLDDARFPAVAPLLGAGHLAIDADARDPRVAGLLRSVLLRLVAAAPPGTLTIRVVDAAGAGETTSAFSDIPDAMPPPVTDHAGLRMVLAEAEPWLREPGPANQYLVVVITSLPELTDGNDLARIAHLARGGVDRRVHLIVAGWPPPPLTAETTQAPLAHTTQVSLRNPYVWVGDPPGTTYSGKGIGPARLNSPVYLDPDPPVELVRRVCHGLAHGEGLDAGGLWAPQHQRWVDYVTAAQRLDAVRRTAAKMMTEQTALAKRARSELGVVRSQLAVQQRRIGDLLNDGRPVPVGPVAAELAAAESALGRLARAATERAAGGMSSDLSRRTAAAPGEPTTTTGPIVGPGSVGGPGPMVVPGPPGSISAPGLPGPASVRSPQAPDATSQWMATPPPVTAPPVTAPPAAAPPAARSSGSSGPPTGAFPPDTSPQYTSPQDTSPFARAPVTGPPRSSYIPVRGPGDRSMAPPTSGLPHPGRINTGEIPIASTSIITGQFAPVSGPPRGAQPSTHPSGSPRLPEAALTMVAEARAALGRADTELSHVDFELHRPPHLPNAVVYAAYALLLAMIQLPLLVAISASRTVSPVVAAPCGIALVLVSFWLGWLTIGFLYQQPGGQRPRRTPLLGAAISLLAAAPGFVTLMWALLNQFH